jgi:hypothetical protein
MQTADEEDARINAEVERLKQLIDSITNKVGKSPLCFDGKELRAHPELNRELMKPENHALIPILEALEEDMLARFIRGPEKSQ